MSPLFTLPILAQAAADTGLSGACGDAPSITCRLIYDLTGNETAARVLEWVVAKPLKVLLILVAAYMLNRLFRRGIRRLVERLVARRDAEAQALHEEAAEGIFASLRDKALARARRLADQAERGRQRAQALGTVLRSVSSAVIYSLAALMTLGEFGVNLGPLIAGAGIAGVALGFGAQTLVRDFLSGLFMLAEDQYGVGDVVDVGEASGVVEEIRLRTTRLRDINGTAWFIPNGEIRRVGNKSQQWARAVLDVSVAYDTDLDLATRVIKEAADAVWHEQPVEATVLEEPQVWGVEDLGDSAVTLRLAMKVEPGEQWAATRLVRRRVKDALDRAGIEIPFPQRAVWLRSPSGSEEAPHPEAAAG